MVTPSLVIIFTSQAVGRRKKGRKREESVPLKKLLGNPTPDLYSVCSMFRINHIAIATEPRDVDFQLGTCIF